MLHVNVRAGVAGENDVAGDNDVLGGVRPTFEAETGGDDALVHHGLVGHRLVLTVVEHGEVEHLRVFDGAAHELVGLHAEAVVGERDDASFLERAVRGELLALHADGDAAGRVNAHGRGGTGGLDELDGAGVVGDGRGVGHAHHGGETAGGGGLRTGEDGLLVRLAGLAEMDVDVDEAGADDEAAGVDHARLFLLRASELGDELAAGNEDIALGVALSGGVDDATVFDPEERH